MVSSIGSGSNPLQQTLSQLFAKKDSNADGKLDKNEIQSLLDTLQSNSTGSTSSSLTADKVISAFDTDGDGEVSGTEFDAKFKKLAENLQSNLISAQENAQAGAPPAGVQGSGHHHHHGGKKVDGSDDDSDSDTSLLDLLDTTDDDSDSSTSTAQTADSSAGDLVQTFLSRLKQYSQTQQYAQTQDAFGLNALPGSSISASA
ncbi:EF-hand domain-containing protein [Ferrovibrio xuzhouensis]|uniref:EF-hand domain-containing protein n=1 Tax=Ferrovibrio xuzhouensis TaxID=1576914 RepID=A0ABV7VJJ0_9PROT